MSARTLRADPDRSRMANASHWTRCTAQREDGSFCDGQTLPDAPFPICVRHAAQVYEFLRGSFDAAINDEERRMHIVVDVLGKRQEINKHLDSAANAVVYYGQIGDHIKIGTTTNLKSRMVAYPPNRRLLATEPGYEDVEAARHREFADLLDMGREWFTPGARLINHINNLRKNQQAAPLGPLST